MRTAAAAIIILEEPDHNGRSPRFIFFDREHLDFSTMKQNGLLLFSAMNDYLATTS